MILKAPLFYFKAYEVYFHRMLHLAVCPDYFLFNFIFYLDYSRIEFAADARHSVCGCGSSPQMPCNEAAAVKSARPKGKLGRHIIKRNAFEIA
jgi:hypothetical protein